MVAATIRKIHAPNQLAAVFEVSGSPDENFPYTFTRPISPTTAPMAYISLVPGSKYELTIEVASLMPAMPFPCAKAEAIEIRLKKPEKEFIVPDNIEDFDIRNYV